MAKEGTPQPRPEGSYNPRAFLLMAANPDHLRAQMPSTVTDVADMSDSMVSVPLLDQMRSRMQGLLRQGSLTMLDVIYGHFSRKQGWSVERTLPFAGSEPFRVPTPMEDLTDEQKRSWDMYRDTGEVSREVAVDAFGMAIMRHFSQLPSVRYSFDPAVEEIDSRLRKAPFQIATKLFPDLQDGEARKLFGNRTAEDIRRIAEEANQSDL
jgi:hypothetical protein